MQNPAYKFGRKRKIMSEVTKIIEVVLMMG
jgi:hypothetical protein